MKLIVFLLVAAAAFSGCATVSGPEQPEAPEKSEAVETATEQPEIETEKEPTEKTVTETVYLVSRIESRSFDDLLDAATEFIYEEEGVRLLEEHTYGMDGELEERKVYKYADGVLTKMTAEEGNGSVTLYHRYSYDEHGNMIRDALYTGREELQFSSTYSHDEAGRVVEWSVLDSNDLLQMYTRYVYDASGKLKKIEVLSPEDEVETYTEIEYDGGNLPVQESVYTGSGVLEKYTQFVYESGLMIGEHHFKANKKLDRKIDYSYDSAGNLQEVQYQDGSEQLRERKLYEYTTRSVQRVVVE